MERFCAALQDLKKDNFTPRTTVEYKLCFIRFPAVPQYCRPLTFYKFDTQVSACAAGGFVFSRQEWRSADLPSAYSREPAQAAHTRYSSSSRARK